MMTRLLKLSALFLLLYSAACGAAFCQVEERPSYEEGGGWLLSAVPFELSGKSSQAVRKAAVDIPTLILEKVAGNASHVLSLAENLDRQIFQLQTERLSLCLQLSRERKVRDGLVLKESNQRKRKKQISEAEKKIAELEESIRRNLTETETLKARYDDAGDGPSIIEEVTVLDKKDFSLLELPDGSDAGQAALARGLSGLISGSIESFGGFISVTAELHCYPGGWSAGSVTEVGELNELSELADNLLVALIPKIANTMPVQIHFSVSPEEALASCQIFIDGILQKEGADTATVSYGEHKVEVCAEGYFTKSVSYPFTESQHYSMVVPMEKVLDGTFDLTFIGGGNGTAYANARETGSFPGELGFLPSGRRNLPVTINGKPILGRFIAAGDGAELGTEDPGIAAGTDYYYYVAPGLQADGSTLAVKLKKRPDEKEINDRRIWSYRAYSAFMLALPAAFLAYGNYMEVMDGFNKGGELQGNVDNAADFSNAMTITAAVAGGFFLFELFRYVHKVSGLLPQEAYIPKENELIKLEDLREQ